MTAIAKNTETISMEEVEKKNEFEEWKKEADEIEKRLKKKDYVLTIYQKGDNLMSCGDHERQVLPRRFFAVCSLEEIPEYISSMRQSFWEHEKGLSKKEIKNYPYEKKKWGRYWDVRIEPLSAQMEQEYLSASKEGFFANWRELMDDEEEDVKEGV